MRLGGISTGSNLGTREIARGKLRKRNQHVACMEHSITENYWYCFCCIKEPLTSTQLQYTAKDYQ